jgi:single-stranded-DNA-specific exonuclease
MMQEAESQLDDSPVQFIYQTGWNPGVLGIVAGQLLQKQVSRLLCCQKKMAF